MALRKQYPELAEMDLKAGEKRPFLVEQANRTPFWSDADNAERERVRRWGEIQDQAETQDRDAVLRQRANETRRRVDNERRQRRGEAAADTSRRSP